MNRSTWLVGSLGLTVAAIAVSPPVDSAATRSISAYMIQHLLLTMTAAPLLAIAVRRRGARPRRVRAMAAWAAFVGLIWAVHLSRLVDIAARDTTVRYAVHVGFLTTAVLFWRSALRGDAIELPARTLAYLFTAMAAMDVVGVWLMSSTGVEYPAYGRGEGALGSQHLAGALMLAGSYPIAVAGLVTVWRWVVHEPREPAGQGQVA